ncbi:alkaline phosphatase family protein, partial [Pseudomonas sp. MAFF212428]|nr:alkaline phosphatase family protein [Pseudomonas brassicae]
MPEHSPLPKVLAGPLLRRLEPQRLVFWLVGSEPLQPELQLSIAAKHHLNSQVIAIGRHAFVHLIDVQLTTPLPTDVQIDYDLLLNGQGMADWAAHALYEEAVRPNFVVRGHLDHLLHGSCRKPHHPAADGLLCADRLLAAPHAPAERPALLMMSGDQVYADDVAGPMLRAIHALIERLG